MKIPEKLIDEILDCIILSRPLNDTINGDYSVNDKLTKEAIRKKGLMEQSALEKAREYEKEWKNKWEAAMYGNRTSVRYLEKVISTLFEAIKELQEKE